MQLPSSIIVTIDMFKETFSNDAMVFYREFESSDTPGLKLCAVFINELADKNYINDYVISPIRRSSLISASSGAGLLEFLKNNVLTASKLEISNDFDKLVEAALGGNTVLLIDGADSALIIDSTVSKQRAIDEPSSEKVVKGPREGFVESLMTNLMLVRKRLKHPSLKCKFRTLGRYTSTKICIAYLEDIASEDVINTLELRLDKIDIDGIIDSGYIKEMIKENLATPFFLVNTTERPDIVAANMLEGKVALFCDGSPFVLTLPYIFMENFQSNEDYYVPFTFATVNRMLRWFGFFLTISVPAVYLSLTTFHHEILPTPLLLSISASRQGVPFPTIVEAMFMMVVFEILREAGTRIPAVLGQAISIVGVLVIGQAAVEAKLISAPMIIVIALSGISGFLVPRLDGAVIIAKFLFLFLAAFLGLYGYLFGLIGMFLHLNSLKSFGVPYMLNTASFKFGNQKDMIIRAPWAQMKERPSFIASKNPKRKK